MYSIRNPFVFGVKFNSMQRLIFSWCSFEIPSTLHNKLTLGGGSDEMAVESFLSGWSTLVVIAVVVVNAAAAVVVSTGS
jgi:hypothetical protein